MAQTRSDKRQLALERALQQIERAYGKGAIMQLDGEYSASQDAVLIEAVHQTIRRSAALRSYFDRLHRGQRNRYRKAIVATGRKVLTLMFAMMRDQTAFSEDRVSSQAA